MTDRHPSLGDENTPLERGATLGRYVVLSRLGHGGMGVVYAAYDPKLDRRVAIKLVLVAGAGADTTEGRARLEREAQALARLNHPNVVAVHDVGSVGDRVYVAMEFVEGRTFGEWMKDGDHPRQEVLDTMIAAGRGLAAAHAKGLVHRDFKPDNVMVGDDGRVRVMDFGLARETEKYRSSEEVETDPIVSRNSPVSAELTALGRVVGTPAYMAPEQHLKRPADARTDQFSFCVALYEALYGERPFEGKTFAALCWSVTQGEVRPEPKGTKVPAWLRRILLRGLDRKPDARWPSMDALLEQLQADPSRARRRRWGLAAVAVLGVAAGGGVYLDRVATERECEHEGEAIDAVLDEDAATAIAAAMQATGLAYAPTVWAHTRPRIDAYVAQWHETRTAVCRAAELEASMSADTALRARECLDERRERLEAFVDTLHGASETSVRRAVTTAAELPSVTQCTDTTWLARRTAPPDDPELRRRVAEVRAALTRATMRGRAGEVDAALTDAQAARDAAQELGWAPLRADADFVVGRRQQEAGHYDDAERELQAAFERALACSHDLLATRAAIQLVQLVGYQRSRHAEGLRWAGTARALLQRLAAEDSLLESDLENNVGSVHKSRSALTEAAQAHRRALQLRRAALGDEHPAVAQTLNNLGNVELALGHTDEARDTLTRALEVRRATFGPDHPSVAKTQLNLGTVELQAGNIDEAAAQTQRALDGWQAALGPHHPNVATGFLNLGSVRYAQQDFEGAERALTRALEITQHNVGPDHIDLATIYNNLGSVVWAGGDLDGAYRYHEHALRIREQHLPTNHVDIAQSLHNLSVIDNQRGDSERAVRGFTRAVEIWEATVDPGHPSHVASVRGLAETRLAAGDVAQAVTGLERVVTLREVAGDRRADVAEDRFLLAKAIAELDDKDERARELAEAARTDLAESGNSPQLRAKIDAWLASR